MKPFNVTKPTPLFDFLLATMHGIKKATLKDYLKYGAIFVNGKPVSQFNHPLEPGDQVLVEKNKEKAETERYRSALKIVYEDETIIVIDKPAGLLTIATDKIKTKTAFYSVSEYLKASVQSGPRRRSDEDSRHGKAVYIVHRLDRDASGLLVLAKTARAKEFLQTNWQDFEKYYYAVVEGTPKEPTGEIRSYLSENAILRVFSSNEKLSDSKLAITHYRVVKSAGTRCLVEVALDTGRKHQIRVHMTKIGHPILGDKDYGNPTLSKRLALHAHTLKIQHPETLKWMTFESPLPGELERLLHKEKS